MPTTHDTAYTARFVLPDLIERGKANTLQCPVYRDGALVAPTSGAYAVFDASNTVFQTGSVTVSGSIAQASVSPSATDSLGEGWRVLWELAMPDGLTHAFTNEAALVRRRLYCPITDTDLFGRVSMLDPSAANTLTNKSDFQDYIDAAWVVVQHRLLEAGNRPTLIVSNSSLREVTLLYTLHLIFGDMDTRLNPVFETRAQQYLEQYESAWRRVRLAYAEGDSESYDPHRRRAAMRTVWLGTTRGGRW